MGSKNKRVSSLASGVLRILEKGTIIDKNDIFWINWDLHLEISVYE